jgi:hypothetical protein
MLKRRSIQFLFYEKENLSSLMAGKQSPLSYSFLRGVAAAIHHEDRTHLLNLSDENSPKKKHKNPRHACWGQGWSAGWPTYWEMN